MSAIVDNNPMQMIVLGERLALTPDDVAEVILVESEQQVQAKQAEEKSRGVAAFENPDVLFEFLMACIALNFVRIRWRYNVENSTRNFEEDAGQRVREIICEKRGYELDDFDSALQGVAPRVRLPYGWSAIDFAFRQAQREPIRLIQPGLAGKKLPTAIANIGYRLSLIQDKDPILLPIDQLRSFLQQRKIVVSGAVQRLIEAGVLTYQDKFYRTGKAREFRFTGKFGEHIEYEKPPDGPL
jgi:hypothetical protein